MPLTLHASSLSGTSTIHRSRTGAGPSKALVAKRVAGKTSFTGQGLGRLPDNGSMRWSMSQWLENKASVEVAAPLETCWALWDDRERIPEWMPWIKSVKVLDNDPRLSRWTLATHQFGRDWEFSWLARNLPPVKNSKIHWVSERGSASLGLEIQNRGQIKFIRTSPSSCNITLIISYEVPDVLVPFANALTPLVEGIIGKDMERFREMVTAAADSKVSSNTAAA
ncbi:hypothetical protein CHLRE_14g616250v5 [Chlamydomonas reinhardtii]|uniref:Coenzyme Q-binding protein COQ10 START domain-containing protein n=1 Tax=Chlamydomonas reinhardtii TaxID=3055 RepID=A0A2K3CXL6_CHLRE|nr:uncharacterized protein CHLRE_14g616250v5 [Chlamydomonas reinhardtii]PNW73034.1 hypothetical protein CHLRE_14g616250v5 [Chlamydomonas reinhardtii]